ncbi:hypothetical protein ACWX0K_15245 [Nitrobacteraceae bacterium UC4446_H13]
MTDEDGHRIDAAVQFGFEWTNDDADEYACTEAQLIAFAKAAERKGRAEAVALLKQTPAHLAVLRILRERNDAADAELLPILEAERVRSLTAAGYVRGTDGRWNKSEPLCDDEGCPHHGTDHVCINRVEKDCEVCGGDCAAANPPVINCPRDECARRGIDPDELCADGGVTAEMVVAKEIGAGCGQAVITPWQTPAPCGGQIGSEWREPCHYCGNGKRTGLPSNACENCMNTGYAHPTAEDLK